MKKILVIAAHPDDEVLGLGGTIAKYAASGAEITLLIITDGSSSQYRGRADLDSIIENKKKETAAAAKILGITRIIYGGLPDMQLDMTPHIEINSVIEKAVGEYKPNTVFTHFYGDINKDHRCVYESTSVACRPFESQCVKKILLYSVPSSTEWSLPRAETAFMPNWYENIEGNSAQKKYQALECYKTELRDYPAPRSVRYLKNADSAEGNRVGLTAAESFMLVRNIE